MKKDEMPQIAEKAEENDGLDKVRGLLQEAQILLEKIQHLDALLAEMPRRLKKNAEKRTKLKKDQSVKQHELARLKVTTEDDIQALQQELDGLLAEQQEVQAREAPKKGWLGSLFGGKNKGFEDERVRELDGLERRLKAKKDELQWAKSRQEEAKRLNRAIGTLEKELSELDELDAAALRARDDSASQKEGMAKEVDTLRDRMMHELSLAGPGGSTGARDLRHEGLEGLSTRLKDRYGLDDGLRPKSAEQIEAQNIADQLLRDLEKIIDAKYDAAGSAAMLADDMREMIGALFARNGKSAEPIGIEHEQERRQDAFGDGRSIGSLYLDGLRVAKYTEIDDSGLLVDWDTEKLREAIKRLWSK
jgi:DNA repair exonuclease SbcCD ATPase subunit